MFGATLPCATFLAHSGGISMVRTLAWFGEPTGFITHVFSRGNTDVRGRPVEPAALAAPSNVSVEQLTSCTTLIAGGIGLGTGRPVVQESSGGRPPWAA